MVTRCTKGQVTLFILLGIVILVVFGFVYVMNSQFSIDIVSDAQISDPLPPAPSNAIGHVTILPLGDSITAVGQYRPLLEDMLKDNGIRFDYIGSLRSPDWMVSSYPGSDHDHEGHGGLSTVGMLESMNSWLLSYAEKPDIVLLMIGGNDYILASAQNPRPLPFSNAIGVVNENVGFIIDKLRVYNPDVVIIVGLQYYVDPAKIVGLPPVRVDTINSITRSFLLFKDIPSSLIVDHSDGWDYTTDIIPEAVPVHPSLSGSEKMAENWFRAIETVVS